VLQVSIDPLHLREVAFDALGSVGRLEMRHGVRVRDEALFRMCLDLVDEVRPPLPLGWHRALRALGDRVVVHLLRHHFDLAPSPAGRGLTDEEATAVRTLVDEQISERLKVTDLARSVGLGTRRFSRLFRETFGRAPHEYVNDRRLHRAHELIVESALPLSEVASSTGFADQSHLTRAFRQRYGQPPAQARRLRTQ
jgi:AraC family transcriptional regulator